MLAIEQCSNNANGVSETMNSCVFCKIAKREIPKEFTYEDDEVMVFPDLRPIKPVHLLIMPKIHIEDFLLLEDDGLFVKIKKIIQKMVREQNLPTRGYRLVIHGGGAQVINHLHIHLLGPMGKMAKM